MAVDSLRVGILRGCSKNIVRVCEEREGGRGLSCNRSVSANKEICARAMGAGELDTTPICMIETKMIVIMF